MGMFEFDERLYTLDVSEVPQHEVPRIIDPNDVNSDGVVLCYEPDKKQVIQLALIIWQVATRDRNTTKRGTLKFELAEERCTATRKALKRLLLPFVDGNQEKAHDLCVTLLRENKEVLDKYIKNWAIISRPGSVWIDEEYNGIFLCQNNKGRVLVGFSPMNYVFVYNAPTKGVKNSNPMMETFFVTYCGIFSINQKLHKNLQNFD